MKGLSNSYKIQKTTSFHPQKKKSTEIQHSTAAFCHLSSFIVKNLYTLVKYICM